MATATRDALNQRKLQLEKTISQIAGCPTEITIRGEREFTLSAEGDQVEKLTAAVKAIGGKVVDSDCGGYDAEIDYTCVFFVG